ncbi:hypothetical protein BDA96_10G069500 [Sorghum bicolor]|uniref:DCD domain-containing protein n=1 Tax=Sorghum bicolor TaxID=4558 RepID=A0A921TZ73_SORBI|nr:hypothetical protein BDA96_10G069500 [Sorghum bicolor]
MVKAQSKECATFGGAVFLCNHLTRKECFDKKIFGLPRFCADFVEKVKAGTTLFLYDVDQCKLHGVFEATSDGAVDIIPDAYVTSGKGYPSQIRFKRIWFCKPLMFSEFQDAVQNYSVKNKFSYGLSHQQVAKLLHLFSSQNRLQLPQNPRLQDDLSGDLETSSLAKVTDVQSSPNSSSCGSFRSTCQTCSSTTLGEHTASLGEKLIDPEALVHRGLQSDISDVAKSERSKSPLQSGADMATVTVPGNQEAMHDQSTDDYIPLPQEEDTFEVVDDLFGLLKDESHSSESKGTSDSENHTTFHHVYIRKEDECYPPILDSKLRADSEGRTSVFSRLVRKNEIHNHRKRFKTEAFPPRSAEFSNALSQRKKQRKAQHNRPFPCHNDGMLDMPSADRLNKAPASNRSFVWTKSSGGKQSGIQTGLGPFLCEDGNKQDVSSKQPARYNTCKKSFVPQGCPKLIVSCDKGFNMPTVFAGVHDCNEDNVKEMRTPFLNCKRPGKVVCSKDVEGEGRKKKRQATASFYQEYPSDTALIPKGTKTMDMLAVPDENFKEKSITLSSKDIRTQLAIPYLDDKVRLQDEQQQSFEYGEDAICDSSLILEGSKTMETLDEQSFGVRKSLLSDETQSHVAADYLGTGTSLQQKETQSIRSCHRVVNGDKILLVGKSETVDFLPGHDEDCENKKILPSDESDRLGTSCYLETEMPLLQKQTPNVLSCSEVVHDDEVLIPEIPEVMSPKFDADCGNQVMSFCSGYREEVCHAKNYREVVPSDPAPVREDCGPPLHGDSAKKNFLFDKTSEHVSTGHQDTVMLPHDEHNHSCCGDTSAVLECTIVDTGSGDGGSEHKNSCDEKDGGTLYLVTVCKDTFSCDGSRSCAPTNDQVCSEVMLLKDEGQYQNLQSNSNSVDSFAVSSEGCGSKSGISVHQVADLVGTNAESRTSFVNDFSSESTETFGASALGGEEADRNVNRSEPYAEPPILQHDPGEAMEQL